MIIHKTIYRKEDGIEMEVVPLKDIVVTAPGYSTRGWNDQRFMIRGNEDRQTSLLRSARDALLPPETLCFEELDMLISPDGGRAVYRVYIEKAKTEAKT